MVNYTEILRLNSLGYTNRQITASVHSSHHTVSEVLSTAAEKGISWPLGEDMNNWKLREILFPQKYCQRPEFYEPDYSAVHKELATPGVTLTLLWEEYSEKAQQNGLRPYMPTQFRVKYHAWARTHSATMRLKHKPGDAMQVDWAGQTLPIFDPDTGDEDKLFLFVAVLPFSWYAYVEACPDMKSDTWINCHIHAYNYFGGVTRLLIPDNLKTGVTANNRYGVIINKSYNEMAAHYGTAVVPTRVAHPKDKSAAESSVRITYQKILAPLRNRKFFSVHEAQRAVAKQLEVFNNTPFQKRPEWTRYTSYMQEEREFMRPLPAFEYEPSTWTKAKVGNDYLVSDGKNKYSVPFDLIGETVDIRLTRNSVEIFFKGDCVATHVRSMKTLRDPVIVEEHMTPEHRKYLRYNEDDFRVWAATIGPKTEKVIDHFLTIGSEPEQGYKACSSLMRLSDRYGSKRLENACERMLNISSTPSVRNIATLIKNSQDVADDKINKIAQKSTHGGITRGAAAFKFGGTLK